MCATVMSDDQTLMKIRKDEVNFFFLRKKRKRIMAKLILEKKIILIILKVLHPGFCVQLDGLYNFVDKEIVTNVGVSLLCFKLNIYR